MDSEGIEALNQLLVPDENNFLSDEVAIEYTCVLSVKAENGDVVLSRQLKPPIADAIGDIIESLNAGAGHVISGGGASFEVSIRFDGRGLSKEEVREVRRQKRMEEGEKPEEPKEPKEPKEPEEPVGPDEAAEELVEVDEDGGVTPVVEETPEPLPEGTEPEPEDPNKRGKPGRRRTK